MSHNRRRREESTSSYSRSESDPRYNRFYTDDRSWRHYAPEPFQRRGFNYWRDEHAAPTFYHPNSWRPNGPESYDERWRNGSRSRPVESSYSRRGRDRYDLESQRDRNLPQRNRSRQQHATYTPPPYSLRPALPANPMESIPMSSRPSPPDPPRAASSPPNNSPQPLELTPEYLAISQQPSEILNEPERIRKLLVLDLNGTLLIRSARSRSSTGRMQLRPVQPRPYMQSFRQYLFLPETKAWLDTMVWSSAQPHSVDDMVDKVFGAAKTELKAVWNRKSLGLSEAEYHRKTVTSKDLTKPWGLLASQSTHSAFTTVLLDDSPHKAVLQPYNHVCIPEYDSARRLRDLRSLLATKERKEGKQGRKTEQRDRAQTGAHLTNTTAPEIPLEGTPSESAEDEPYDVTLLAVIGILEAVKSRNNVAGWVRGGGLRTTVERQTNVGGVDIGDHRVVRNGDASGTSDPAVMAEQAHLQTKMWFDDTLVVAHWAGRGRRVLAELGIQVVHGVTG